jgi:predicted ATPase/class 3 adenylate cyclase
MQPAHIPDLPTGTLTFLFTDMEGSTQLWERYPEQARTALARHDRIIEDLVSRHGGTVVRPRGEGDSRFAVFSRATDAVAAAAATQQALNTEAWPTPSPLLVRMAVHTGEADLRDGDYYGSAVNRCARLRSAAHGGQTLLSSVTQELVRDHLPEGVSLRDLGEHLLRDLQQPGHIFQLVVADLPSDFPPLKTLDARPNNLPSQRTMLVGRDAEVASIQSLLLRDDVGLLTLTGPGGIGKTRLALQVAAELIDEFPDGVYFVSLAHITDPNLVAPAIAQTLGVTQVASREMVDTLADYLSDKRLLLLLDNFEQVVAAGPLVARLPAAARQLKLLVTSREVLHVRDEQEFAVPPLGVPDPSFFASRIQAPSSAALTQYEAVALFIQRARLVKPDFDVTNQNAPAIAEICYRLDGLPLAIELAAARIRILPPEAMLSRLASRLKLLTAGPRDLPERQQTLKSTIQWSYDLLQPGEQMLFRRLSVFSGGATLEAIEAVCNADGALQLDVLDGVSSLFDKSLIYGMRNKADQSIPRSEEPRFGMLETIREFGMELLRSANSAEAAELCRQHALYYLALAEQGATGIHGHQQIWWLDRLEVEHENLQAALSWAIQQGDAETTLDLASALRDFWDFRSYYNEGYKWLTEALALPGAAAHNARRAGALIGLIRISFFQNDWAATRAFSDEGVAIFRELELDERRKLGRLLAGHGSVLIFQGEREEGRAAAEEGISVLRQSGDKAALADGLVIRGIGASAYGDLDTAQASFEEGAVLAREVGHMWALAQALNSLGDIARLKQDYARARELYEESLGLYRLLNDRSDIPASLHNLGHVALAQGDIAEAKKLFAEALQLQVSRKNRHGVAECLAGLAGVAGAEKEIERAARLFGAAEAIREDMGALTYAAELADYERNLAAARAQLGGDPAKEAAWDGAWQEGRAMSIEQAIAYALQ